MRRREDRGLTLAGMVVVLGVLSVILVAFLAFMSNASTHTTDINTLTSVPSKSTTTTLPGATTTTIQTPAAALIATCVTDYRLVSTAVGAYSVSNSTLPPHGVAWATSSAKGGPYLHSWPVLVNHTIRWTGTTLIVVPKRGTSSASAGTASPPTGCYAV
jgi:Na+-transporting methylmalonyl-CoA/oxaloacetate decarboxylase gamma subunit